MGPLLGPSLGPISPFPLAALKLDEIDQNALLPNQKTVQSDSFAPFFVRQYHNKCCLFSFSLQEDKVVEFWPNKRSLQFLLRRIKN